MAFFCSVVSAEMKFINTLQHIYSDQQMDHTTKTVTTGCLLFLL